MIIDFKTETISYVLVLGKMCSFEKEISTVDLFISIFLEIENENQYLTFCLGLDKENHAVPYKKKNTLHGFIRKNVWIFFLYFYFNILAETNFPNILVDLFTQLSLRDKYLTLSVELEPFRDIGY